MSRRASRRKKHRKPTRLVPPAANPVSSSEPGPGSSHAPAAAPARRGRLLVVVRLLLGTAFVIVGYLAWVSLTGDALAGCAAETGCDQALQSRWAYLGPLPVSLPAVGVYLALLTLITVDRSGRRPGWHDRAVVMLAAMIVAAALYFVGLQLLVIKSICKYCMAAHACGFAGAVILLARSPLHRSRQPNVPLFRSPAVRPVAAGLAGVFLLGSAQALFAPPQYEVASAGSTGAAVSNAPRRLAIHDGQFELNLDELPITGSPDAEHVIVCLFDYACSHCRTMHRIWAETQKRFGDRLAIVSLPTPLDQDCNHLLKKTQPAFKQACDYARLGLALWRVDRIAHRQFEAWVFHEPKLPALSVFRERIVDLIGSEPLDLALADEWINRQIKTDVAILLANYRRLKKTSMPQAIVGEKIVVGTMKKPADINRLLAEQFGLSLEPADPSPVVTSTGS